MDKKSLIALVLIGIIFLLWPVYMKKIVGVKEPEPRFLPETEQSIGLPDQQEKSKEVVADKKAAEMSTRVRSSITSSTVSADEDVEILKVETNLYKGEISTLGGGTITRWQLKKFEKGEMNGELVELIPDSAVDNLSLVTRNRGMDLENDVFKAVVDTEWVEQRIKYRNLTFARDYPNGGRIEKEFIFSDNNYCVKMNVRFISFNRDEMGEGYSVQWKSGLSPTEREVKDDVYFYQAYALQGNELLKTKDKDTGLREGFTRWVGVRTKYFLMAIIADEPMANGARLEGNKFRIFYNNEYDDNWKTFTTQLTMPYSGYLEESGKFTVYLGPIDYQELKSVNAQLEKTMNFGMAIIKPFSIAFYYVFQFFFRLFRNYGWAIIVFSVLIKIVLYPLTRKSFQSMKAMQALQPKVAALKEKYKNDPQKLNQATMELYKKEGVNPMGGCLPMLLQMPVLFALFNLFRTTIMLRQAPFIGIQDLSAPDGMIGGSINVLPVLMGITMIIQQRLTNSDPKQKAMAFMMPIFLTFIFYKLSAGLNLYYLMFNLLTIAQELFVKQKKASE